MMAEIPPRATIGFLKETDVQSAICDYLALRKHFFFRCNNHPIYDPRHNVFRALPKYTMKGIPDIIVIRNGGFVGLEVKLPIGQHPRGRWPRYDR